MQPESFKTRYSVSEDRKLHKRKLLEIQYPDSEKFKRIYTWCGVSIALSILLPVVWSSFSLEFFWNDNSYNYVEKILFFGLVTLAIGIIFIAVKLSPVVRSRILFGFFAIILGLGLIAAMISVGVNRSARFTTAILFMVMFVFSSLGFYSFNILLSKYNNKLIKKINAAVALVALIALVVPIVGRHSIAYEILRVEDNIVFLPSILMLIISMSISMVLVFISDPVKFAKVNSYVIKTAIALITVGVYCINYNYELEDALFIMKFMFGIYGVFFLICYSFIEYITVKMTIKITPFARPVLSQEGFIHQDDKTEEQHSFDNEDDPYKVPADNMKLETNEVEFGEGANDEEVK